MTTTAPVLSETLTSWQAGEPCEKHDLSFCGSCREQAGLRRDRHGDLRYEGDCTVQSFIELTGADYAEAVDILRSHGYRPGHGAPMAGLVAAVESVGYSVSSPTVHVSIDEAVRLSAAGRVFLIDGVRGRKAHAWTVIGGRQNRPYQGSYRYNVREVTA